MSRYWCVFSNVVRLITSAVVYLFFYDGTWSLMLSRWRVDARGDGVSLEGGGAGWWCLAGGSMRGVMVSRWRVEERGDGASLEGGGAG